jgi:endonuclease YncB( thermonuclease family)
MFQNIINRINPINENVSSVTLSDYGHLDEICLNDNKQINWKDTIEFVAPIEKGIVIKVYDGDTITIASKLPYESSPLYRFSVRLNGIDCPEIKSKDENEKECAKIAKKEMNDLIMNKMVTLKNVQTEKYGRILADVYIGDLHLNQHMIEKRLAVTYDGGTKMKPTDWMNYYCKGEI